MHDGTHNPSWSLIWERKCFPKGLWWTLKQWLEDLHSTVAFKTLCCQNQDFEWYFKCDLWNGFSPASHKLLSIVLIYTTPSLHSFLCVTGVTKSLLFFRAKNWTQTLLRISLLDRLDARLRRLYLLQSMKSLLMRAHWYSFRPHTTASCPFWVPVWFCTNLTCPDLAWLGLLGKIQQRGTVKY